MSGAVGDELRCAEEGSTEYVLLILDRCWGVSNRVRTMVWAMMLAISHRLALVVLWEQNKGCQMAFKDIFPEFDKKQENLLKKMRDEASPGWLMPFIKVISYAGTFHEKDHYFRAHRQNPNCLAELKCQGSVETAWNFMREIWSELFGQLIGETPAERALPYLWNLFEFSNYTTTKASLYLKEELKNRKGQHRKHVGVHCRRNDMVTLIENTKRKGAMQKVDKELWAFITETVEDENYLIHFITDSKEYLETAYRYYGKRIGYGLHWDQLKDTRNKMCSRSCPVQVSLYNFSVLMQCEWVYCDVTSSFTEWISNVHHNEVQCFETTNTGEWHWLTKDAERDIGIALRKLFDLHYTAVQAMPHPKDTVFPATLVRIVRKLTDRALDKIVQLLDERSVLPNAKEPTLMSTIGQMISTASTEDISYGILTENRREFIERAKELGLKQGWNTILFRIIFFDFLFARFGVKTEFFGGASNASIRFIRCSNSHTECTWKECREEILSKGVPPWKRAQSYSSSDPSERRRKRPRLAFD